MSAMPRRVLTPLRTEAVVLIPGVLLLLVSLSLFVVLSYRETTRQLLTERGEQAERMASRVASRMDDGRLPQAETLHAWAEPAWAVAVLDRNDVPLVVYGDLATQPAVRGLTPPNSRWALPARTSDDVVAGRAALLPGGRAASVRVDLLAHRLLRSARALRVLVPMVIAVDVGLLVLLLIYLRRLVVRFDDLVARVRQAGARGTDGSDPGDEVALLVTTIDRALATMAESPAGELAAFERAVAHSLDGGVLLLDALGRVLAASTAASDLLAIAPAPNAPLASVLARHPGLVRILVDAVEGRSVRREECLVDTGEGPRTLGLSAHPLRREDGSSRGFLVLFADLTAARERAERERLADRLAHVGTLAAGVAHEMRNSLATVRGYLGLAERAHGHERDEMLAELRLETDRLERVLEDFLRFARPGSVRLQQVDLLALLRRCAMDPGLGGATVRVTVEPAAAHPESAITEADPHLLSHALRNLLRNALEAHSSNAASEPVVAALRFNTRWLEIAIGDRGPGIDAPLAKQIFEPFAAGRAGGVGLGLAITRRIVVLHDGEISLRPRAGGGTWARIRLPRPSGLDTSDTKGSDPAARSAEGQAPNPSASDVESAG